MASVQMSDVAAAKLLSQANATADKIGRHSVFNPLGTHATVKMAIDQYQAAAKAAESVDMVDEIAQDETRAATALTKGGPFKAHLFAATSLSNAAGDLLAIAKQKVTDPSHGDFESPGDFKSAVADMQKNVLSSIWGALNPMNWGS